MNPSIFPMKRFLLTAFSCMLPFFGLSQDKFTIDGYLKEMHTFTYGDQVKMLTCGWTSSMYDNLLHNRINLRWYPGKRITGALEIRNRILWGDQVRLFPNYLKRLEYDQEIDLSYSKKLLSSSMAIHSKIDRAWFRYSAGKWELTLGRQRINWGVSMAWNPNDLFNTYKFVDFDYEERPGSDAVRIQFYPRPMSSVELVVKPAEHSKNLIAAGLYKFNRWGYDFQFLGGKYYSDIALGTGWAGNIRNAGLKGEATYFHPENNWKDTSGVVLGVIGVDYMFSNSLYWYSSLLFNSSGAETPGALERAGQQNFLYSEKLSAKTLMPVKYTVFSQLSYPFSPLFNGSLAAIYSPGVDLLFLMPNFTFSIQENWDIDLIGQTLMMNQNNDLNHSLTSVFLRLKWSF